MASTAVASTDLCKDCKLIHEMKGSELSHLIHTLAHRNRKERREICDMYMKLYGQELVTHLQRAQALGQIGDDTCSILSLWMLEPYARDAVFARQAIENNSNQLYRVLIEIYVGRKSSHLHLIKQAYLANNKQQLDHDITSKEPTSPFQRILEALDTAHKSHDKDVSKHVAQCDAMRLYEAVEGRLGRIDEAVVIEIFSKRCIAQLKMMFSSYKQIYGHDFTKSLKKKTRGEFEDALRITAKCMYTPEKYYAKMLHMILKGSTTDENALPRLLMNIVEINQKDVLRVLQAKYGMEIQKVIQETIPKGEYKEFLVALAASIS